MKLKRLCIDDLKLTQALSWNVYDESMNLLLCKGYVVNTESQIDLLLERGMYVSEDEYRNRNRAGDRQPIEAMFNPFSVIKDVQSRLSCLLKDLEKNPNFSAEVQGLSATLRMVSEKDPDVGVSRIMLVDGARYAVSHMIHVAFVAELVSKRLGWSDGERQNALCAAMTMNLAMIDLQHRLHLQR